ncbi:hypothetical protein [Synechococcus sp. PCC 7336]|uniref:hypothetical protein n=1 Tax=Synechococcus sp. PCC 7336 TaxID=195250 RepID=UPI00036F944B|nr:hypothetical protein [Synechococcus sp. PCC 7336]
MKDFLRQYIVPALIFVVFAFTLFVVSARSFLPGDMAQPAPTDESALSAIWQPVATVVCFTSPMAVQPPIFP